MRFLLGFLFGAIHRNRVFRVAFLLLVLFMVFCLYQMSKPLGHNRRAAPPSAQVDDPGGQPRAEADRGCSLLFAVSQHLFQRAWFRVATSSPARRRIFAYLAFARGEPQQHLFGRFNHAGQNVLQQGIGEANCACTRVKSDCTCFPVLARVAAIRASS